MTSLIIMSCNGGAIVLTTAFKIEGGKQNSKKKKNRRKKIEERITPETKVEGKE